MNMYELILVEDGVYVGEIKKGKPNGKGILKYTNGSRYVGEFKEGKYQGQGMLTCCDSTTYEGEWEDNHMHGRGRLIIGDDVQEGFWFMGSFECDIGDELKEGA